MPTTQAIVFKPPCPNCGGSGNDVIVLQVRTRNTKGFIWRQLLCKVCNKKYSSSSAKMVDEPKAEVFKFKPSPIQPINSVSESRLLQGEAESLAARLAYLLKRAVYGAITEAERESSYRVLNEWEELRRKLLGQGKPLPNGNGAAKK